MATKDTYSGYKSRNESIISRICHFNISYLGSALHVDINFQRTVCRIFRNGVGLMLILCVHDFCNKQTLGLSFGECKPNLIFLGNLTSIRRVTHLDLGLIFGQTLSENQLSLQRKLLFQYRTNSFKMSTKLFYWPENSV